MKLAELEPRFLRAESETVSAFVDSVAEADGIIFLCPKCFAANGGARGTHSVICWQPHVPPERAPRPGRWRFEGAGLADLSLVAGSSSVLLTTGCMAHFLVQRGEIVDC